MKKKSVVKPKPTFFDWDTFHQRLEIYKAGLVIESEQSLEVLERAWAEHAQQLAETPLQQPSGKQIDLLFVKMGNEVYAFEVDYVFDIRPAEKVTHVPHVPDWVRGVFNLRGHILSVVDLSLFLGLSHPTGKKDVPTTSALVSIKTDDMECAFLVDLVLALDVVSASEVRPTSELVPGLRPEYVGGVVESHGNEGDFTAILLKIRTILTDERLVINQASG